MTNQNVPIPERELRDLQDAFNSSFDRQEKGDLAAENGHNPFEEWLLQRTIIPLILEVNYGIEPEEVELSNVTVGDDGTVRIDE